VSEREPVAPGEREADFRRVLVALDASRASRDTLEASARLAARLSSELAALFVEDVNLLRMAALPFARVVGPGCTVSEVDVATVERSLRGAAAEAQASLEAIARRHVLQFSFRVVRDLVVPAVMGSAGAGDLVVVEQRSARTALDAVLAGPRASILLLGSEPPDRGTLVALYEADAGWERGVRVAARLAAATGRSLAIAPPEEAEAAEFETRLSALLGGLDVSCGALRTPRSLEEIAAVVRARPRAVVALPRGVGIPATGVEVDALLRVVRCAMLIVR
jgi:hypothetical protein